MSISVIGLIAVEVAALVVASPVIQQARAWQFHADHVLGTSLDVEISAVDAQTAIVAAEAIRREIVRLEAIYSGWSEAGELYRVNLGRAEAISPELARLFRTAAAWRTATGGAFDERLGAVDALWSQGGASGIEPDTRTLHDALMRAHGCRTR